MYLGTEDGLFQEIGISTVGCGTDTSEQEDKIDEFKELNFNYRKKFNFPFIIAVKGKNKNEILNKFKERINNSLENEFLEAKNQVKKIATFRLEELIK